MKLQILLADRFKIAAVMKGEECETLTFLNELEAKYQSSADGLFSLIDHIAKYGLDGLSSKQCHLVDQRNKIYELIKGDIRLLFFKGQGDLLVVTTHAFLKKTPKTPEQDKNKAVSYKNKYHSAHDKQQIIFVDTGEEDGH